MKTIAHTIAVFSAASVLVALSAAGCHADDGNTGGGGATGTTTSSEPTACGGDGMSCMEGGNMRCLFKHGCFGNGETCFSPGNGSMELCTSDADCNGGMCTPCGTGKSTCQSGCTDDASCGPGFTCTAEHRCALRACQTDADCPGNFRCATDEQTCQRKTCQTDADCASYCVEGFCNEELGSCVLCI